MKHAMKFLIGIASLALINYAVADDDYLRGLALYKSRCTACHSQEYNGVGPAHKGVYGRKAGVVKGFAYSQALKSANVLWNEKSLNQWLEDPEKFLPGQKMGFKVPDANERADLIVYLKNMAASQ